MQNISPLPDADGELAIAPTGPLAPARPSAMSRKWTAAIVASCLFHAAVAAAFLIAPAGTFNAGDAIEMEGADQTGDNVVGSALNGKVPGAMNVTLVPDPQPAKPEVKPEPPADQPTGDRP
ncbi:MAG: energy transducer TonB, partial [Mesorhizobium sp.]